MLPLCLHALDGGFVLAMTKYPRARNFENKLSSIRILPGAREPLKDLSRRGFKWAIATVGP